MCGILYVSSRRHRLPHGAIQQIAAEFIAPRGPTHRLEFISDREYICQSVLAVQSRPGKPARQGDIGGERFILYNGEIYSNTEYSSDTEALYRESLKDHLAQFLGDVDGMYAIAEFKAVSREFVDSGRLINLYRDPAGEKHLYYFINSDYFAISSVPGALAELAQALNSLRFNKDELYDYFARRHYISPRTTPFADIYQVQPGEALRFSSDKWVIRQLGKTSLFEAVFDPSHYKELSRLASMDYINMVGTKLTHALTCMERGNRSGAPALTMSGGIDSTLVSFVCASELGMPPNTYTCLFKDKDPVANTASTLSNKMPGGNHIDIDVSLHEYMLSLKRCIRVMAAPIHSHSLPSSRILASHVACSGKKVLYGGEGADELFLGYSTYIDIIKAGGQDPTRPALMSAYNSAVNNIEDYDSDSSETSQLMKGELEAVYCRFLDAGCSAIEALVKSNAFIDYAFQLPMVGLAASDIVISDCGIEARTPFTRKEIVSIAVNAPLQMLISTDTTIGKGLIPKLPLQALFRRYTSQIPLPKTGFSGYPNETKDLLGPPNAWRVFDLYPHTKSDWLTDRAIDWKIINIEWFLQEWKLG